MAPESYDVIVIGAGQGGVPLAQAMAGQDRKVALVEREHVGGTCINEGCTPTKTMVASARAAYLAGRAGDYGVLTGPVKVDMLGVRQRKRQVVESYRSGSERRVQKAGVNLIEGEAHFSGPKTLDVTLNAGGSLELRSDLMVIDTGTRPALPDLPGLEQVTAYDSTSIMELDTLPEHLLIVGGGYVGVEFGQMFRRFGSRVTIVQRGEQLLAREDQDVAEALQAILVEDGLEILLDAQAKRVKPTQGGIELQVITPAGEQRLSGSHLLLAAGRTPNTGRLNLSAAGVEIDKRGFIPVNERLETNVPGIYALGDVNGGPAFTHISYDDYRILCANLLNGEKATTRGRMVPYVVFTDPQLGRIGLTETQARKTGLDIQVAKIPMNYISRAVEVDEARGMMKAVVDKTTERILGAAILGIEGGELMAILEVAMMGGLAYPALRDGIFAHPTLAEGLNTLFSNFTG